MNVCYLIFDWTVIGLMSSLFLFYPGFITFLVLVIFFSSRQHALLACLHEASHGHLLKNPRVNRLSGSLFCAFPMGVKFEGFKHYHLLHHRFLNSDLDPSWIPTKNDLNWSFPMNLSRFLKLSLMDLLGFHCNYLLFYEKLYSRFPKKNFFMEIINRFGFYGVFYLSCFFVSKNSSLSFYCLMAWVLSKYTALIWLIRIRTIVEHYGDIQMVDMCRDVSATFWEEFFIVPHNTGLHILHHQRPDVPAWKHKKSDSIKLTQGIFWSNKGIMRELVKSGKL